MDDVVFDLATVSLNRLEAAVSAGAARIAALQCKWLLCLGEYVAREGFAQWGMTAEAWLSWRCGLDRVTAREHLRVAAALRSLPKTTAAFAEGRLSFSKVRVIARTAVTEDEAEWLAIACDVPATHLSRLAGRAHSVIRRDEAEVEAQRSLTWRWDDDGMLVGQFRLAPDEGAAFIASIERAHAEQSPSTMDAAASTGSCSPVDAAGSTGLLKVDAFVQLVTNPTPTDGEPFVPAHQPEVVLHVTAGELDAEQPTRRHLVNGQAVGPATARRLACDPILTALLHDPDGRVIDVGRRHRLVTKPLRRAVYERDEGRCVFPGCTNYRWLDVHHVQHWEDGGPTNLDNLVLLCSTHHRAHHTGAFDLTMEAGAPVFTNAHGHLMQQAPAMRAVPAPGGDLLAVHDKELGPAEGTWDGSPITNYAVDCVIGVLLSREPKAS